MLTDDELAYTESGVEQSVLSASEASPASALCISLKITSQCAICRPTGRCFSGTVLIRAVRRIFSCSSGRACPHSAWLDEQKMQSSQAQFIMQFTQQEDEEEVSEHICEHWGHRGELWAPDGRILDVSNAGFEVPHCRYADDMPSPPLGDLDLIVL